ncbi:hypothetical protein HELRODRAFT_112372 [Helobdella robusta]|uniref:Luc7-like protein 3 n=1 Tax=Helobdella robusta TaxID=6412 RepID=T1EFJ1_HELRO|nr:hypothetical protein HELRODRAFT_112372 [Helobdella robusta]ESO03002.1 hypothetical protein HELRODRAFT_112372 [Helobdella robusta]
MASYAAALLDELMGRNRDSNPHDISVKKDHWSDEKMCKYFLCGFCPHDLFINTKADLGKCTKLHDEEFRMSYQGSDQVGKMGYEKEFERLLLSLANDIDRRIKRGEQRLASNNKHKAQPFMTPSTSMRQQKINELTDSINKLVAEAETLGCEGKVDEAKEVMERCDKMKMEKNSLAVIQAREQHATDQEMNKVMEVCNICGALLVVGDPQQRQDEHITGKLHMGYAKIKAYLKEKNVKLSSELMKMDVSSASAFYRPSPYTSIDLSSDLKRSPKSRSRERSHSSQKKHRSHSKSHKSKGRKHHRHHKHHHQHHHHRSRREKTPDN